jgi:hypothetical protein
VRLWVHSADELPLPLATTYARPKNRLAWRTANGALAMWFWLSDPANQKTLAFVGGGVSVVVAGAWAVFKTFFEERSKRTNSSPSTVIKADRGGLAAGRYNIVTRARPKKKND